MDFSLQVSNLILQSTDGQIQSQLNITDGCRSERDGIFLLFTDGFGIVHKA